MDQAVLDSGLCTRSVFTLLAPLGHRKPNNVPSSLESPGICLRIMSSVALWLQSH